MSAAGILGSGNTASWKEEVLLHDGSKIIVERWQKHGGRHEPGQRPGIAEQTITFTIPVAKKVIKWKDDYSEDIGHSNFELVALHIFNNVPYIITKPDLSLSYNKWGRPNPPYIIFKFEGREWQRIDIRKLPVEFKNINLVVNTLWHEKELVTQGMVSAETIKRMNSSLTQEEYKTIIRTPLKPGSPGISYPVLIRIKDGWESPDGGKAPIPIIPYGTKEKK